jgi:hypothetical protein
MHMNFKNWRVSSPRVIAVPLVFFSIIALTGCGSSSGTIDRTSGAYSQGTLSGTTLRSMNADGPAVNNGTSSVDFALSACQKLAKTFLSGNSIFKDNSDTEINYVAGCLVGLGWSTSDAKLPGN